MYNRTERDRKDLLSSIRSELAGKQIITLVKIGIIVAIAVLITCGVCVTLFTMSSWRNNSRLIDAQIRVYDAQSENVGKPQIIEQRYFSPNNK